MNKKLYTAYKMFGFVLIGLGIAILAMTFLNVDKAILDVFKVIGLVCSALVAVFFIARLIMGATSGKKNSASK